MTDAQKATTLKNPLPPLVAAAILVIIGLGLTFLSKPALALVGGIGIMAAIILFFVGLRRHRRLQMHSPSA